MELASTAELCAFSAIGIRKLFFCDGSNGPKVTIRSWVRSRLVLKNEPLELIFASDSVHAGVILPLVVSWNLTS
jgi:hypothetical protein